MKKITSLAILSVLAACQSPAELPLAAVVVAPKSADEALEPYYRSLPEDFYPRAPAGLALPDAGTPLTRILVGSCLDEEKPGSASLRSVAAESADLFLMIGDNVYGDRDGPAYVNNQPELNELRASYADLAAREDFKAVRAKFPMMVAWDDHDYGANDAGRDFHSAASPSASTSASGASRTRMSAPTPAPITPAPSAPKGSAPRSSCSTPASSARR